MVALAQQAPNGLLNLSGLPPRGISLQSRKAGLLQAIPLGAAVEIVQIQHNGPIIKSAGARQRPKITAHDEVIAAFLQAVGEPANDVGLGSVPQAHAPDMDPEPIRQWLRYMTSHAPGPTIARALLSEAGHDAVCIAQILPVLVGDLGVTRIDYGLNVTAPPQGAQQQIGPLVDTQLGRPGRAARDEQYSQVLPATVIHGVIPAAPTI
jgi:hypothetical protein